MCCFLSFFVTQPSKVLKVLFCLFFYTHLVLVSFFSPFLVLHLFDCLLVALPLRVVRDLAASHADTHIHTHTRISCATPDAFCSLTGGRATT